MGEDDGEFPEGPPGTAGSPLGLIGGGVGLFGIPPAGPVEMMRDPLPLCAAIPTPAG